MAVLKSRGMLFDLDAVYSNNELIDYSKGLTAEEKKEMAVEGKINFGQIKAGSIAARGNTSGASVQTATPGKQQKDRERLARDKEGDDTVADSVKTYDVDTTIGSERDGSECSLSSGDSIESVDMEEYVSNKKRNCSGGGSNENDTEINDEDRRSEVEPPSIRRTSMSDVVGEKVPEEGGGASC